MIAGSSRMPGLIRTKPAMATATGRPQPPKVWKSRNGRAGVAKTGEGAHKEVVLFRDASRRTPAALSYTSKMMA